MNNKIKMRINAANRRYFRKNEMLSFNLFSRPEVLIVYSVEPLDSVRNMRI